MRANPLGFMAHTMPARNSTLSQCFNYLAFHTVRRTLRKCRIIADSACGRRAEALRLAPSERNTPTGEPYYSLPSTRPASSPPGNVGSVPGRDQRALALLQESAAAAKVPRRPGPRARLLSSLGELQSLLRLPATLRVTQSGRQPPKAGSGVWTCSEVARAPPSVGLMTRTIAPAQ